MKSFTEGPFEVHAIPNQSSLLPNQDLVVGEEGGESLFPI